MNETAKNIPSKLGSFFRDRRKRGLFYLILICLLALCDFLYSGLARRTFIFYSDIGEKIVVEDRMLRRSADRETDIRRYVEEALLGPSSQGSNPLFPRETRLNSFMYRDSVVFADLSEPALQDLGVGGNVFRSLLTLNEGIRRNYPSVKDVRLFIGGNQVFFEEFRQIFTKLADNTKSSP